MHVPNNSKMANAKGLISENSKEMAVQRGPLKSDDFDKNGDMVGKISIEMLTRLS